jgi:hypothetical protein
MYNAAKKEVELWNEIENKEKSKLNGEKIWKIGKKSKFNGEKI